MKIRYVILLSIVALLFVSSLGLAQPERPPSAAGYSVQQEAIPGGKYHLVSNLWQVQGIASGGGYRLLGNPISQEGTGTPCCCMYLPCVLRQH